MLFNFNKFSQVGSGNNNAILLLSLIVIFLFYFIVMPLIEKYYYKEKEDFYEKLSNTMNNNIDNNKCSRSCCLINKNNWAVPNELIGTDKSISPEELKKYIPSNLNCNGGSGGGCVCITNDDYVNVNTHGGNKPNTLY